MFQSTRPRGARPPLIQVERGEMRFQSTRPRGARRWGTYVPQIVLLPRLYALTLRLALAIDRTVPSFLSSHRELQVIWILPAFMELRVSVSK